MKTRIIHTKFWQDSFICDLNIEEKITFFYLLTNSQIGLSGVYELPDKFIIFDLDISQTELNKFKDKFSKNNKIIFYEGYVALMNSRKYNDYSKGNPNQVKAYNREIELLPSNVKKYLYEKGFEPVVEYMSTSRELVGELDIKHKTETINNKSENKNNKTEIGLEGLRARIKTIKTL